MHHNAYNLIEGVKCYSIYPSEKQTPHPDPQVKVLKLNHPIPICESASPVSTYRWHSFSDDEFETYKKNMEDAVYKQMDEAEKKEGTHFKLAVAHHTFLNPLVMRNVIQRRIKEGKPPTALACFAHGTALRMYLHEIDEKLPEEFPMRFLPMVKESKIFDPSDKTAVEICYVISQQQVDTFLGIFSSFSPDRIVLSPNGVNQQIFHRLEGCTIANVLKEFKSVHYEGSPRTSVQIDGSKYDHVVVLVCRFADSKRIPSLLYAASTYEKDLSSKVATLIVGTGPLAIQKQLQDLAYNELKLEHTYFLGPQPQPVLAKLYTVASIGAFPFHNEAFGMVFVECMACGTPVIGANSGGPIDFVDDTVGILVPETDDIKALGKSVNDAVQKAIKENWKVTHSKACINLVESLYSIKKQVGDLLDETRKQLKI